MNVQNVSMEDGRNCAILINLLKVGRWDLSGAEAEQLMATRKWVAELAQQMASQLKSVPKPAPLPTSPTEGFKVKSMGSLPVKKSRTKKK